MRLYKIKQDLFDSDFDASALVCWYILGIPVQEKLKQSEHAIWTCTESCGQNFAQTFHSIVVGFTYFAPDIHVYSVVQHSLLVLGGDKIVSPELYCNI